MSRKKAATRVRRGPSSTKTRAVVPAVIAAESRSNRGRRFPPEPLRPEEVEALARSCNPRYPTGARNRALVYVLAHSGLRCSEALHLNPKDYEPERGALRVLRGKGGKHRLVPVSGAAATALVRWFEHRARLGLPSSAPVFSTLTGGPLATAYARKLVKRLAERAGIEKRVHVHGLRHSFAVESIRRGVKINVLSKVLGHANSGITSRYVDHLGDDDAVEAVRVAWDDGDGESVTLSATQSALPMRDGTVRPSRPAYPAPPIPHPASRVRKR